MRDKRAGGAGCQVLCHAGGHKVRQGLGKRRALKSSSALIQLLTGYIKANLDLQMRRMKHLTVSQNEFLGFLEGIRVARNRKGGKEHSGLFIGIHNCTSHKANLP